MRKSELIYKLGRRIAWLRRKKGLSQEELAFESNKVVNTISQIERGVTDPKLSSLEAIAEVLETDVASLIAEAQSYPVIFNSQMEKLFKLLQYEDENTLKAAIKLIVVLLSVKKNKN